MTINSIRPYTLASIAEVNSPDSQESPGAEFLKSCHSAAQDILTDPPDDYLEDAIHEAADGVVPIYTYELWKVFVDLCLWDEEVTEFGEIEDFTKAAEAACYMVAQRLIDTLVTDESYSTDDDPTDDEDDDTIIDNEENNPNG